MSESFDPYHKLLGISKRDQPPTLYRLLGLEVFECDREVIDAAANKQMAYLQGCCNGQRAASAERLMNEVSKARLRLLNLQSKESYDTQLRITESLVQPDGQTFTSDRPANLGLNDAAPVFTALRVRQNRRARKKRSNVVQWFVGAVMSCAVVWFAVKLGLVDVGGIDSLEFHTGAKSSVERLPQRGESYAGGVPPIGNRSRASARVDAASMSSPPANWNGSRVQTKNQPPTRLSPRSSDNRNRSSSSSRESIIDSQMTPKFSSLERERMEEFKKLATMPDAASFAERRSLNGRDLSANVRNALTRVPIPSEDEQAAGNASVDSAFAAQIKGAKTPHEKQHLGTVIVDLALQTKPLADRYALLKTALETFSDAGDFKGVTLALDQMLEQFELPELEQRSVAIQKLEPLIYRPLDQIAMADQAEELIERALIDENFATAGALCTVGQKLAQDLRNRDMVKKFSIKMSDVEILRNQHVTAVLARERLASEPDNPKANEFLGRFLCLGKSQWNEGLSYLGRGEESTLRELAIADMRPQSSATELESIAGRWWDFSVASEAQPLVMRTSRQRAVDCYRRAIAHGLSGLAKALAEKRVAAVQEDASSDFAIARTPNVEVGEPKRPRGVPEAAIYFNGNWYLFSNQRVGQPEAIVIAQKAGGHPVVVRSQAEHDFLLANAKRPLMLGMMLREGVWYDALNERQYFFLWDVQNRQPDPGRNEAWAAISELSTLWHDFDIRPMYFAIEWGRE